MTIFDTLRYPITNFSHEEWESLPSEIRDEILIRYDNAGGSELDYSKLIEFVRKIIAEHNT